MPWRLHRWHVKSLVLGQMPIGRLNTPWWQPTYANTAGSQPGTGLGSSIAAVHPSCLLVSVPPPPCLHYSWHVSTILPAFLCLSHHPHVYTTADMSQPSFSLLPTIHHHFLAVLQAIIYSILQILQQYCWSAILLAVFLISNIADYSWIFAGNIASNIEPGPTWPGSIRQLANNVVLEQYLLMKTSQLERTL